MDESEFPTVGYTCSQGWVIDGGSGVAGKQWCHVLAAATMGSLPAIDPFPAGKLTTNPNLVSSQPNLNAARGVRCRQS